MSGQSIYFTTKSQRSDCGDLLSAFHRLLFVCVEYTTNAFLMIYLFFLHDTGIRTRAHQAQKRSLSTRQQTHSSDSVA